MLGLQGDGALQGVLPLGRCGTRECEHEVDAYIVEPGGAGKRKGFLCFLCSVAAPESLQLVVVEALHAHAYAVKAVCFEHGKVGRGDVVGVALYCYFGVGDYCVVATYGGKYFAYLLPGEERRGATAKIYGAYALFFYI